MVVGVAEVKGGHGQAGLGLLAAPPPRSPICLKAPEASDALAARYAGVQFGQPVGAGDHAGAGAARFPGGAGRAAPSPA